MFVFKANVYMTVADSYYDFIDVVVFCLVIVWSIYHAYTIPIYIYNFVDPGAEKHKYVNTGAEIPIFYLCTLIFKHVFFPQISVHACVSIAAPLIENKR